MVLGGGLGKLRRRKPEGFQHGMIFGLFLVQGPWAQPTLSIQSVHTPAE